MSVRRMDHIYVSESQVERQGNMSNGCETILTIREDSKPVVSILMFSAGLVGNVLALVLLGVRRKEIRTKSSVFCILVTGLAVTDLMGTCFLSPVVFVSYAQKKSLIGLVGVHTLCDFFSFAMTFFGVASTLILFAMAVERCLAISHPYFYSQHIGRSFAKSALPVIYAFAALFCIMPLAGFGEYRQYCPGTWCFLKMESDNSAVVGFSLLYATLIAFLIVAILLCNGSVIVSLCKMHRNQRTRRGSVLSSQRRRKSWFGQREEEVDHLILLAAMTAIFAICSLPLTHVPKHPTSNEPL
ncbi:prostacyclin receptor isoform X2 [Carcharodon carcharias]|uniref:prostacyclin receptor isoform X2 n=1 Tax=Carcharodon carcharias TaxID=13397 RepID=UPI001B7E14C2|nr:prostacyclin receptor isoform X2 [Carcharodon carcharias]